jgi:hypothetical protein
VLFADASTSSGAQSHVPFNPSPSGTDAATAGAVGGMALPPGEFLQNIIQMAANAALQGQAGRQSKLFNSLTELFNLMFFFNLKVLYAS